MTANAFHNMPGYLLIDDSPAIRLLLAQFLETILPDPPIVHEAGDVETALDVYMRERPNFVFLDMMLPMTGRGGHAHPPDIGTAERPRADAGVAALSAILRLDPAARIVIVTALPRDHPDVTTVISLGAHGYLRKPIARNDLREVLVALE